MGPPIKSPQLKEDLLLFTPVEILGEIFCGSVYNYCLGKLITRGAFAWVYRRFASWAM
jgi:hypothetical protein